MKNLNTVTPKKRTKANQNLIRLKKQLDKYKLNQPSTQDYDDDLYLDEAIAGQFNPEDELSVVDDRFIPEQCFDLKNFFGLLTTRDILEKFRSNEYQRFFMGEEFIDYEMIQQAHEDDLKVFDNLEKVTYYNDVKVLLVKGPYSFEAYKIGPTIHDCKYIGFRFYIDDIFHIIDCHLKTGECNL
jgi:hypothetical protein